MGSFEDIDPWRIAPLHGVRQRKLLSQLVASMRRAGWRGRPLLVIEHGDDYIAWTGSHRIAAAREAKLDRVPCYVMAENALKRVGADAEWGHVEDQERLSIVVKTGDEAAINLMWQEGRPIGHLIDDL